MRASGPNRRFWQIQLALLLAATCGLDAAGPAQSRSCGSELALVAGDFNHDRATDLLVLRRTFGARIWFGRQGRLGVTGGPQAPRLPQEFCDLPVFVGRHLYVPRLDPAAGKGYVHVYDIESGDRFELRRVVELRPWDALGLVTSLKICPLDIDVDGDAQNDLVAIWGETPLPKNGFHAGYVTPAGLLRETIVPPLPHQPARSYVADVHPSFNYHNARSELLVMLTADRAATWAGFGIAAIGPGPKTAGGHWFAGAPALAYGDPTCSRSPSTFGNFSPAVGLGVPLLQTAIGASVLMRPTVTAPYVRTNEGALLPTTSQDYLLDACTGDYDGDGRDEVVVCLDLGSGTADHVVIADPGTGRAYAQVFRLGEPRTADGAWAGARGDFDADGDADLLLASRGLQGVLRWVRLENLGREPGQPVLRSR